jgi:hypothetical protein
MAALALLDGKAKSTGVMAPEGALDAATFLDALSNDFKARETVTETAANIDVS